MDVVFAVLPFADVSRPAIGVSLLQAEIARAGFCSCIQYLNLRQAELMGLPVYQRVADGFPPDILLGEWFFADRVFSDTIPHEDDYPSKILARFCATGDSLPEELKKARASREEFLTECVGRILRHRPKVVGLTTTFHQTCACLAVAQRLKAAPNPPVIVLGGANCEGEMGLQLIQSFPWIDYVCSGEADISFPALLEKILHHTDGGPIPGVLERGQAVSPTASSRVMNLDNLPIPDYRDYFEQVARSPVRPGLAINLPIETARGCWWGAKQHCTFCGLNGDTMAFRSKSPERAYDEMTGLARTYGVKRISGVDNILDLKYVTTVFPRLQASGLDLELFYEVKTNLRYEQLAALRAGGLTSIQPGIESLSDQVLRLMRKGCSTMQNLQLLRWGEELGIQVGWNLLAGFPGESPSEYERMATLVPWLMHLQPPSTCTTVRLDRFSPFFSHPEDFGFQRIRPSPAYYYAFPLGRRELGRLAYFFDFDYGDGCRPRDYMGSLQSEVQRWCEARLTGSERRPRLDAKFTADALVVTDTRELATAPCHRLKGLAAELYFLCDTPQSFKSLLSATRLASDEPAIRSALGKLREAKLLLETSDQFLSLAIFRNRSEHHHLFEPPHAIPISQAPPTESLLRVG